MASLAWALKASFALLLPEGGRRSGKHAIEKQPVLRMEFKKSVNTKMWMPVQIVRTGWRIAYWSLSWNPWQQVFLRAFDNLRTLRC